MTTAYNIRNKLARSSNADRAARVDPGSAGIIVVSPVDRATCVINTAGGRTLEAASGLGVGTTIRVFATVASVTVNSVAVSDGASKEFVVGQDAAGANEWQVSASSISTLPDVTGDTSLYAEATITGILDALVEHGLITDSTTT